MAPSPPKSPAPSRAVKPVAPGPAKPLDPAGERDPAATGAGDSVQLRKKELIDLVVERSGVRKKDAKPVVEATLALLGEAFAEDAPLNLQPLGKLRVVNRKALPNGQALTLKLRRSSQAIAGSLPLAGREEDG